MRHDDGRPTILLDPVFLAGAVVGAVLLLGIVWLLGLI